jgi:hypothetical protein
MGDKFKDVVAGLVLVALYILLGLFGAKLPIAVNFVGLFAVLFSAYVLGKRLFPRINSIVATGAALLPFFALQSLTQTVWFYAGWSLGSTSDMWCQAAAMLASLTIYAVFRERDDDKHFKWTAFNVKRMGAFGACLLVSLASAGFVLSIASRRATSDALLTPWTILPPGTIPAIVLAWLAIFLGVRLTNSRGLATIQSSIALASTTAITPFLYRIGYGFDGFLHVATEKLILATETLTPKPLYYIGQYVFTTWISRGLNLPIEAVDRWLVPIATAVLLPLAIYLTSSELKKSWSAFLLFLIPLAPFIATTPQSFAYLLGFTALLLCRGTRHADTHWLTPLILACWAVAVHPLAGLPFILIIGALIILAKTTDAKHERIGTILALVFAVASAIAVPVAFYVLSLHSATPITWNLGTIFTLGPWRDFATNLSPWIGNRFVVWPAWASLAVQALPFLLIAAAAASIARNAQGERKTSIILLSAAFLLFIAGALLKSAGDFAFLIDYERGNYADRLNLIALFCLFPAALPFLEDVLEKTQAATPFIATGFLACLLAVAGARAYDALPRNDALITGHGWSVGQADIAAAKSIDRDANGALYTVLADQSVSAAAVSQLGFKRYNGDTFFYPIPTGGPLYDEFLRMTYQEPSRDTVADAAQLGGTTIVYVVVNDYWWNAANLDESLRAISDNNWTVGDATQGLGHSDEVFKFDLSKPHKASADTSGS